MRWLHAPLLILAACAPTSRPGVVEPEPRPTVAGTDERAEKMARAVARFEESGRPDRGWSPPPPARTDYAQLRAKAEEYVDLYNGGVSDAALLVEVAFLFLAAERVAPTAAAEFEALAQVTRFLRASFERYPEVKPSPRAMLALGVAYHRLGTYDDKAQRWFRALTEVDPDGACAQLAWIALGDRACQRGEVEEADLSFARAQAGANQAAAALAAIRSGCRDLDAPLGAGFFAAPPDRDQDRC